MGEGNVRACTLVKTSTVTKIYLILKLFPFSVVPGPSVETATPQQKNVGQSNPQIRLGTLPNFPTVLKIALQNQDSQLKCPRKTKIKSNLIQVIFDHLSQFTL